MFSVVYYNAQVEEFIKNLDVAPKALKLIEELSQKGHKLDMTHSKTRCAHIFKLRIKSKNHCIRIFYGFSSHYLLILHAYLKKDSRTRNKELDLTLKRYKELKNNFV